MGLDFDRWLKYAKARIDAAVGSGHRQLDELEAEREAERADKPWLTDDGSDAVAPSMDQVRARIEWEAERQGVDAPKGEGGVPDRPEAPPAVEPPAAEPPATAPATTPTADTGSGGGGALRSPQEQEEDAEREMARLELEARQKASAERLDEIRRELGVDGPTGDGD